MANIAPDTTERKPARKPKSVNLADRHCEAKPDKRLKLYDKQCRGFYVSITPRGVATFNLKYTNRTTGRREHVEVGVYHRELLNVDTARAAAYHLKGRVGTGEDVAGEKRRDREQAKAAAGLTMNEIIDLRIEWMKTPVKQKDGEMRPRVETWDSTERHFERFVRPRLGKKVATEVTKRDIATLQTDIIEGKLGKPSVANARHMRRAVTGLFNWAAEAGRDYVATSPCVNLPPLDKEHPRTRVLSPDEIRIFWHGLDRPDVVCDWRARVALKFMLTTMMRSRELLGMRREELVRLDGKYPRVDVPARRVKKRRMIRQPLSDLALELIRHSLTRADQEFVFASPQGDKRMGRQAMSNALRGTKRECGKKATPGICALLGLKPFTPHDLRRTAASLAGDLGCTRTAIAACLDHQKEQEENVSSVTGEVYDLSPRMREKREVLGKVAKALRAIIAGELRTLDDEEWAEAA
jgi:integrase